LIHGQNITGKWVSAILRRLYTSTECPERVHNPRATFKNMLFQIYCGFNYYLQLSYLQFLSKTRLHFLNSLKFTFDLKVVLFLSLFYQSMIVKIVHLQNNTFTYELDGHYILYLYFILYIYILYIYIFIFYIFFIYYILYFSSVQTTVRAGSTLS
jgi:hypothetical protein